MKVKLNKDSFQQALALVTSIVPTRTPKPILHCIKLTVEEDSVLFSATDLEVGINCRITQVEVEQPGQAVLPADKLNSIVRESVDDIIQMESEESAIHLKGADSHFTIYGHDVEQFPQVPAFDNQSDFQLSLSNLQEGIERSVFAAARESTRYAINGILWEVKGKKLTLVATDGRRLAKAVVPLKSAVSEDIENQRTIVPAKAMNLLDRVGTRQDADVQIKFIDNKIIMACDDIVVSSNLVEGNFPRYEDIIPSDYKNKVLLPTEPVLSAARRAALLASEDSKGIKIAITGQTMTFSSRAPETGDAEIELAIDYKGPELEIGFNPQFIIDVLRVINTSDFEFEFGESDRPGVIKCGNDFLYIVMPVNI
jgi:DNA polymerase-3 subunit beta